jgi:hypothetical protein
MATIIVHMIKILMLYVQEHAHDNCHGKVFGHVYIYPNPLCDTLKSIVSNVYEFVIRSQRGETPKVVRGRRRMVPLYHGWFRNGLRPYWWYIRRYQKKWGQIGLFMESPEYAKRSNLGGRPPCRMGPTPGRLHHVGRSPRLGLLL